MKIYNIHDARTFFQCLTECEGTIELIEENGNHRQLFNGSEDAKTLPFHQIYGSIPQIELKFHKDEDCHKILSYLMNRRNTPA